MIDARTGDRSAVVRATCGLRRQGRPAVRVARQGDRLLWEPPPELQWEDGENDITAALDAHARVVLRSQDDETEWVLPTATTSTLPDAPDGEAVRPRVIAEVRVDPAVAAAGAPLPPGRYDVRLSISLASFAAEAPARVDEKPFTIMVTPDGYATPSHQIERAPRSANAGQVTRLIARVMRPLRRRSTTGRDSRD